MELEVVAAVAASGLSGLALGAAVVRRFYPAEVFASRADAPRLPPGARHKHEYDHVRGDGKGWRCGLCDEPQPRTDRETS